MSEGRTQGLPLPLARAITSLPPGTVSAAPVAVADARYLVKVEQVRPVMVAWALAINGALMVKAGLTSGLTAGPTQVLGLNSMAGIRDMGDGLLKGSFDAGQLGNTMLGVGGRGLFSGMVSTTVNGGGFEQAFMHSVAGDFGALGANAVGMFTDPNTMANVLGHASVGCLAASIASQDCVAGGIGAATSALITPPARDALYSGDENAQLVRNEDGVAMVEQTYKDPLKNVAATALSMLAGGTMAGLMGRDTLKAADAARNEALNNALSPKLKELANAGPNCKAGSCVQYVNALQMEKARTQQEYDACMRGMDCTAARAADLGSELLRLQTAYEQTVRRGIYVGDLKWAGGGSTVPTDYFDGLTGLGGLGLGRRCG